MSFIYNIFNCLNQENKRFTIFIFYFFINFTLNSRNNSKRVSFRRNSNFPIVGFFFFFFLVLKLVSFTFIHVKDGWKKKKKLFDKTFSYICGFHYNREKYTKKIILFYYISIFYLFTFFFFP
jgi:hypothetical protein